MASAATDPGTLDGAPAHVPGQAAAEDDRSLRSGHAASACGTVTDIQRFSLHDGPGIRTTVFLKGCSLRCFWCHNPECMNQAPEIQVFPERCIGCGACIDACESGALAFRDRALDYRRDRCVACGRCVRVCCARARVLVGVRMTAAEVACELLQDLPFYERSGGGATISGGEPVGQPDFCLAILEQLNDEGVHTALETAGNYPWEALAGLLRATDLVMMDIKHMSAAKHCQMTGVTNERILDNARRLAQTDKPVVFRTPIVPTVNDTPNEIGEIATFVRELLTLRRRRGQAIENADISLELLPYHPLATDKYRGLSLDYRGADLSAPSKQKMSELTELVKACGITVSEAGT